MRVTKIEIDTYTNQYTVTHLRNHLADVVHDDPDIARSMILVNGCVYVWKVPELVAAVEDELNGRQIGRMT